MVLILFGNNFTLGIGYMHCLEFMFTVTARDYAYMIKMNVIFSFTKLDLIQIGPTFRCVPL